MDGKDVAVNPVLAGGLRGDRRPAGGVAHPLQRSCAAGIERALVRVGGMRQCRNAERAPESGEKQLARRYETGRRKISLHRRLVSWPRRRERQRCRRFFFNSRPKGLPALWRTGFKI